MKSMNLIFRSGALILLLLVVGSTYAGDDALYGEECHSEKGCFAISDTVCGHKDSKAMKGKGPDEFKELKDKEKGKCVCPKDKAYYHESVKECTKEKPRGGGSSSSPGGDPRISLIIAAMGSLGLLIL